MKIKSVTLNNIGPYQGENILNFDIEDMNKNVTLIGGKNGAGKTTLFTAIKVCLYGNKAFGFETIGAKYYAEISHLINSKVKTTQDGRASISMEVVLDDGKQNNVYIVSRNWIIKSKGIKEDCLIKKNGQLILRDELQNFITYLDGIVPAELFSFFFFDGEKIGDYFLSNDSKYNFKKAFLSLCGLDSISLMVDNFERVYRENNKNSDISRQYYDIKNRYDCLVKTKEDIEHNIDQCNLALARLIDEEENLEKLYTISGGLSMTSWKEINKQLIEEESFREAKYRQLREISNCDLPFIIVREQMTKLQEQIDSEIEFNKTIILKTALSDDKVTEYIRKFCSNNVNAKELVSGIFALINTSQVNVSDFNELLSLSNEDEKALRQIIENKKNFEIKDIEKINKEIEKSLKITKKARKKLEISNIDKIDEFLEQKNEISKQMNKFHSEVELNTKKLIETNEQINETETLYMKKQKAYEQELKANSINDISGRALLVYKDMETKLIRRYSTLLQERFMENFNAIINKNKFIDGIDIDSKLNVRPYKLIKMKKSEFKKLLNNYGEMYFIKEVGVRNYSDVTSADISRQEEVILPVIINTPFSQGEKQVYIMSLYISLLQIAKVNVPFIIDTPFARIDSEHREKIINSFFKKIQSQIIILSTDEEIIGRFETQINDIVSSKFMLESYEHGISKITKNKYFDVEAKQ